jgi:putative spermidine/putrescine transport system ATP-binding protein
MALADLVVVMNHGRIEQATTAREVFNKPASAFVARFIGGHNSPMKGAISIRTDRAADAGAGAGARPVTCAKSVSGTPFGGSRRRRELTAVVPERTFFAPLRGRRSAAIGWDQRTSMNLSPERRTAQQE